jgi:hypothetical protein
MLKAQLLPSEAKRFAPAGDWYTAEAKGNSAKQVLGGIGLTWHRFDYNHTGAPGCGTGHLNHLYPRARSNRELVNVLEESGAKSDGDSC